MPEGMATTALIETCLAYRVLDRLLEHRFRRMMSAFSPCAWITRALRGRENVPPLQDVPACGSFRAKAEGT